MQIDLKTMIKIMDPHYPDGSLLGVLENTGVKDGLASFIVEEVKRVMDDVESIEVFPRVMHALQVAQREIENLCNGINTFVDVPIAISFLEWALENRRAVSRSMLGSWMEAVEDLNWPIYRVWSQLLPEGDRALTLEQANSVLTSLRAKLNLGAVETEKPSK